MVRNFAQRLEILLNVRNSAQWLEILFNSQKFCSMVRNFAQWLEILLNGQKFCSIVRNFVQQLEILFNGQKFCSMLRTFAQCLEILLNASNFCSLVRNGFRNVYTFQGVVFAAYPNTPLTSIFSCLFDSLNNDRGDQYSAEVSHVCNCLTNSLVQIHVKNEEQSAVWSVDSLSLLSFSELSIYICSEIFRSPMKPNMAANGGLSYVSLSLPTRSFMFTCIVKIAQGD